VVGLVVVTLLAIAAMRRLLPLAQHQLRSFPYLRTSDERLIAFFTTLANLIRRGLWLWVLVMAARLLGLPALIEDILWTALRLYLIIAGGRLLVSTIGAIIDTIDALSEEYIRSRTLDELYNQLRSLIPLFSRTLEYIIYVQAASLAIAQIDAIADFASYGIILTQMIALIFLGRVVIEVLHLLIDKFFLLRGSLSDGQWQQRLTFAPLLKSIVRYVVVFGGALAVLSLAGFDIGPILIGLGGLGLVVGLAAQPVTTDLISGLFILFENLYLVGDYIETGSASGVVESIDVRTTRIRSPDGQLHLIRNGQIGDIVNYSKGYVYAVVLVGIASDVETERAFAVIRETGQQLAALHPQVLEPTQVQGIEAFGDNNVQIRTATRVQPGYHQQMAREFRTLIRAAFAHAAIAMADDTSIRIEPQVVLRNAALPPQQAAKGHPQDGTTHELGG
jgi:moderate conductance mechanosensitive channel